MPEKRRKARFAEATNGLGGKVQFRDTGTEIQVTVYSISGRVATVVFTSAEAADVRVLDAMDVILNGAVK